MNNLSIVVLTFNSQKYLREVLGSCSFADEVVVLDSGSTDETLQIAGTFDNVVVYNQEWLGFGKQKQAGVNQTKNEWVFVLDSDEVISGELGVEIVSILKKPAYNAYFVPRLNYFFGKPIKKCGLYPDATLRFFNKFHAEFSHDQVHEKVITDEKSSTLKGHMVHFAYEDIEEFVGKQNRYSSLNSRSRPLKAMFGPYWTFFRIYFLRLGFLEGWHGFVIAKLYAQYTFWKYVK